MSTRPSLAARIVGVLRSPHTTLKAVAESRQWGDILAVTFMTVAASTLLALETDTGELALLDQWEQTAAAFGRELEASQYAALERAAEYGAVYALVSAFAGGPLLSVALAALLLVVFRLLGAVGTTYGQVLAVVAHAGIILGLRQLLTVALLPVRETLTSPMTANVLFGAFDEASPVARFLGVVDLFLLWWVVALAIGVAVLYRRSARRLALVFVSAYALVAAVLAIIMTALRIDDL